MAASPSPSTAAMTEELLRSEQAVLMGRILFPVISVLFLVIVWFKWPKQHSSLLPPVLNFVAMLSFSIHWAILQFVPFTSQWAADQCATLHMPLQLFCMVFCSTYNYYSMFTDSFPYGMDSKDVLSELCLYIQRIEIFEAMDAKALALTKKMRRIVVTCYCVGLFGLDTVSQVIPTVDPITGIHACGPNPNVENDRAKLPPLKVPFILTLVVFHISKLFICLRGWRAVFRFYRSEAHRNERDLLPQRGRIKADRETEKAGNVLMLTLLLISFTSTMITNMLSGAGGATGGQISFVVIIRSVAITIDLFLSFVLSNLVFYKIIRRRMKRLTVTMPAHVATGGQKPLKPNHSSSNRITVAPGTTADNTRDFTRWK